MPFDSLGAPPEWRRTEQPDTPWSRRDRLVAAVIVLVLAVITVGECSALLRAWTDLPHGV